MKEENIKLVKDFEAWLVMKNYKPRGIEEKLRAVKKYLKYTESEAIDLQNFGINEAEKYREDLRLAVNKNGDTRYNPKTINGQIAYLRLFYNFLLLTNSAVKNSFLYIDKMKESDNFPKNILNIEEMKKLLSGIEINSSDDFKFKVLIEILYSTGARISEIENLMRIDIHENSGYIVIRDDKARQERNAPLTEYSCDLLKLYLAHFCGDKNLPVFAHGKKRALNRWINSRLNKLTRELELPLITCHGMRHSIATHLLKNGADIREVQELLGHRRIKNTEIYTRIFPEDLKEVIEKNHPREI